MAFNNKDNISKIYSYEKNNFEKSKFEVYLKSNDFKVYYPKHNSFCDDFESFCSYQKFEVKIKKIGNYLFINNNWNNKN